MSTTSQRVEDIERRRRTKAEVQAKEHEITLRQMRDQLNGHLTIRRHHSSHGAMQRNRDALNWALEQLGGTL